MEQRPRRVEGAVDHTVGLLPTSPNHPTRVAEAEEPRRQ